MNGEARVYEIKTELDKLDKIQKQIEDYRKFGNKIYIVAHQSHLNKLVQLYGDSEIGLIELTKRNALKEIKVAKENENIEIETLFKTLRKDEYQEVISRYYDAIPDVPNTLIFRECLNLAKKIPVFEFQKLAIEVLKKKLKVSPRVLRTLRANKHAIIMNPSYIDCFEKYKIWDIINSETGLELIPFALVIITLLLRISENKFSSIPDAPI